MHADFHELTDIAAGRRPAGEHVSRCRDCRAELARVKSVRDGLAALPSLPAPRVPWSDVLVCSANRVAPTLPPRYALALAASILLLLAAAILLASRPAATPPTLATPLAVAPRELVAESARLEALLAGLPERSTTRVGTAYTIAALEDQLAMVDDRLTTVSLEPHAPELAEGLWRERVTLLQSLVEVRYARMVAAR
jgi:hypothetical protein